ncbi:pitrilysin family protein [Synechococcus sp. MIT S9504]|uniref:M16 family metallopeptidase n=1 Tax=Synechococcus sp. MIT S9504 TaxID=1801628 RepID=UPI0007BBF1ED|nr:pitrilysin family protein [Synechococcus sp. MIT S9504]KZR87266.1 Insulinase (Peptidase family M16) [Synechococcus sp. MIT S9504]
MGLCHGTLTAIPSGPVLEHRTLANGSNLVTAAIPDAALTCLDFWCQGGSAWERSGEEGIAHFLEHMVFKGSRRMGPGEFDRRIEALGGSSNAATGFDDVHYHVLVPSAESNKALDLLLDLVLDPALEQDCFLMERDVVLEEIAQYRDQPDDQVLLTLLELCCAPHCYGRPILGWENSLREMNPGGMRCYHKRRYQGANCCLSVAGTIQKDLVSHVLDSPLAALDKVRDSDLNRTTRPSLSFRSGRECRSFPRLEAARLMMIWPVASADDQLAIAGADLATTILAEGRRSRLVQKLREELQIVESIDMDVTTLEQGSLVMLEACCPEDQIERVETEIHRELDSSLTTAITDEELHRAMQLVGNGHRFSLEAPGAVAASAGSQTLWGRHRDLLAPLQDLLHWNASALRERVMPLLQPQHSFTLIARSEDNA